MNGNNSESPLEDEEELSPEEEKFIEETVEKARQAYERREALKAQQAGNTPSDDDSTEHEDDEIAH